VQKKILNLVEKTKQIYVLLVLTHRVSTIACFDLMMFLLGCDFLGVDQVPKHITINLFKACETSGQTLARNL
jgi:hypothetical protein